MLDKPLLIFLCFAAYYIVPTLPLLLDEGGNENCEVLIAVFWGLSAGVAAWSAELMFRALLNKNSTFKHIPCLICLVISACFTFLTTGLLSRHPGSAIVRQQTVDILSSNATEAVERANILKVIHRVELANPSFAKQIKEAKDNSQKYWDNCTKGSVVMGLFFLISLTISYFESDGDVEKRIKAVR